MSSSFADVPVLKWKYRTNSALYSSPAIGADGTLYFGTNGGYLYAINADSTLKWMYQAGGSVNTSPAVGADGTIYFGSLDSCLYALNDDGSLKWKYQTGYAIYSSPAIGADGTLYFGSYDDYFYALHSDGSLKWKYLTNRDVNSSPAIGADGTLYFGNRYGYLYALNADSTLKWKYQTSGDVYSSPAVGADGTLYFGSQDKNFYALQSDGTLKWKYQTSGDVYSSPAVGADGTIYFGSNDTYLYALNADGSLKWKYQTGGQILSPPAICADGTLYFGSQYSLYALHSDGSLKWNYPTAGTVYSCPAIGVDGMVYFASSNGYLYAFDSGTGAGLADSPWPKFHHDAQNTGRAQELIPDIALSTYTLDFGQVSLGSSGMQTFHIQNEGNGNLAVSGISSDNEVFTVDPASATIAPGDSQAVTVTFSPTAFGYTSATITITSNDPDEGSLAIPASGKGIPILPTSTADIADDFEDGDYSGWTVDDPDVWEVAGGVLQQKTAVSYMGYGSFQHFAQWDLGEIAGDFTLTLDLGFNENAYPMIAPDSLNPNQVILRDFGLGIRQSPYDLLIAMLTRQQGRRNGIVKFRDGILWILYAINNDPEYIHSQEMGLDIHEMRPMKISRYSGVITVWADGEVIYQASDTTSSDPVDAGWVCVTGRGPVGVRLDNVLLSSSADPPPAFSPPAAVTDLTFELEEGAGHVITSQEGFRGTTDAGSTVPGSFMGWWVDDGITPGSKSWAAAAGLVTVARNLTLGPQFTIEGWFKFFKNEENIFSINFDGYLIDQSWGRERSYMVLRDLGADGKRLTLLLQGTTVTPGPDPDIVSDYYFDGDPSPVVNINYGEWAHVSWIRDGSLHTVYVNGCKVGSLEMPRWGSTTLTGVQLVAGNNANYGHSRQIGEPPYAYIDKIKVTSQAHHPAVSCVYIDPVLFNEYVAYGLDDFLLKENGSISGGNAGSNNGADIGVKAEVDGNVSTGGDLRLKQNATVDGDANVGGELTLGPKAEITGTVTYGPVTPLTFSVPAFSAGGQSFEVKKNESLNLPPGTYDALKMKQNSELTLNSGSYFFNSIDFGTKVEIHLDLSGGPLYVYVVGQLEVSEGSKVDIVSATGDASQVFWVILGEQPNGNIGTSFIGVKAQFIGTVIAPNSKLWTKENSKIQGALYGKELIVGVKSELAFARTGSAASPTLLAGAASPASAAEAAGLPKVFSLSQNSPNPFNPSTTISYSVPEGHTMFVTLKVYDLRGRLVQTLVNELREASNYSVFWDGTDLSGRKVASGVYFYRLQAGEFTRTRKMVLLK
ncbi:MAG TPA: PQQ-binding-like beta-propeller repeat protein [archaeon]|nr:PQQ-binding-like beta-propeller repeat protein [archaeon]